MLHYQIVLWLIHGIRHMVLLSNHHYYMHVTAHNVTSLLTAVIVTHSFTFHVTFHTCFYLSATAYVLVNST